MSDQPIEPDQLDNREESEALDQMQPEDTLVDRGVDDVLDEGYTAPEKWSAGEGFGTTAEEVEQGESLDQRLEQEIPEADPYGDVDPQTPYGDEVGDERSGRLVAPDEGVSEDAEKAMVGDDVGIDGAGAGAEEAAVRVREDDPDEPAAGTPDL